MKRNIRINNKAFSLLEVTVVIIILTILASAAIPVLSRSYLEKASNKIALDISEIQEAARAFYIDHNKWPDASVYATPIAALQAGNYLPSSWNGINPFGVNSVTPSTYSYYASSTVSIFTVYTYVPIAAEPIIQNLLPTNWVNGNTVYSSVSVPGASSVLPTGSIMAWASNNLPSGFLWCNGQTVNITSYPGLYAVLGTSYGGDGIDTFGLPDLMGRVIVGVDGMGSVAQANRISIWGTSPATVGGTFGEDVHTLTMLELPAASFNVQAFMANGSHEYGIQGSNNGGEFQTANSGMNLGSGIAHNIVQPSMALGYIIKY